MKGRTMTRAEKAVSKLYGKAAEHKIKMTTLADTAGVTRVTLANWRAGRTCPRLEEFLAVEEALEGLVADRVS